MRVRTSPSTNHSTGPPSRPRSTQAERRARSRAALLESAARGLSRYGYGNLVLERVAREAGYTRGALYHQFKDKEELALAVLEWVNETWWREVGTPPSSSLIRSPRCSRWPAVTPSTADETSPAS